MSISQEAVLAAPPVAVAASTTVFGLTLPEWQIVAVIFYTVVITILAILKHARGKGENKKDESNGT